MDTELSNKNFANLLQEMTEVIQSIGQEGIHAIILVIGEDRISQEDAKLAGEILNTVFDSNAREKLLLVKTRSGTGLSKNSKKAHEWIEENKGAKGFSNFYDLIQRDPNKMIFLENGDPEDEEDEEDKNEVIWLITNLRIQILFFSNLH